LLAFASEDAPDHYFVRRGAMIDETADQNAERIAEIDKRLKKLDAEMASPNIKEVKHQELAVLHRQLTQQREALQR
jgi:hypothetical protein